MRHARARLEKATALREIVVVFVLAFPSGVVLECEHVFSQVRIAHAPCWYDFRVAIPEMQCLLDALVGPSPSASTGDRYLVYGPPLGLHDQAVALRNALA